jgi:hypothetical protein
MRQGMLLLALVLGGCAGDNDSEIRSLDRFASGKSNQKSIADTQDDSLRCANSQGRSILEIEAPQNLLALTEGTVAAIPVEIQRAFKDDFGGKLVVSENLQQYCRELEADNKVQVTTEACFAVDDINTAKPKLVVAVAASRPAINHQLIRAFGFLLGQLYSKYKPSPRFTALKASILRAFLVDLVRRGWYHRDEIDALLAAGAYDAIKTSPSGADVAGLLRFNGETTGTIVVNKNRADFEDELFADAFDSYYCNADATYIAPSAERNDRDVRNANLAAVKNTRKLMNDMFEIAHALFGEIDKVLTSSGALSLASPTPTPKPSTSPSAKPSASPSAKPSSSPSGSSERLSDEARKELCAQFPSADVCKNDPSPSAKPSASPSGSKSGSPSARDLKKELCELFPWANGCDQDTNERNEPNSPTPKPSASPGAGKKLPQIIINIIIEEGKNGRPPRIRIEGGQCRSKASLSRIRGLSQQPRAGQQRQPQRGSQGRGPR